MIRRRIFPEESFIMMVISILEPDNKTTDISLVRETEKINH